MALQNIFRRTQADTGPHRSAEVDTGAQQIEPAQTVEPRWEPLVVGTIHHPRERAILLLEALIAAGYSGKSIYHADLALFHAMLCKEREWAHVSWVAICRELKRIGIRKAYMRMDGERLTMYTIAAPSTNVVKLSRSP